jgi:hypothetical protein
MQVTIADGSAKLILAGRSPERHNPLYIKLIAVGLLFFVSELSHKIAAGKCLYGWNLFHARRVLLTSFYLDFP